MVLRRIQHDPIRTYKKIKPESAEWGRLCFIFNASFSQSHFNHALEYGIKGLNGLKILY